MKKSNKNINMLIMCIVLIFSATLLMGVASAQSQITTTRSISEQYVQPGETITVTLTVNITQNVSGLVLNEDLPPAWIVTPVDNGGAAFRAATVEWLWLSASAGDTKTVIYNIAVPLDAIESIYNISGNVQAVNVTLKEIDGENNVNVSVIPSFTATRSISEQYVQPGETITVTLTVNITQNVSGLLLNEDLPTGWIVTPVDNGDAAFRAATVEWLWLSASAGDTKTVIYNIAVPLDAIENIYPISGNVHAVNVTLKEIDGENNVSVLAIAPEPEPTSITVTPETEDLNVNDAYTFTSTVLPLDANQSVTWTVDDEAIGTIDANGLFTALTEGTVIVTATSVTNPNIMGNAIVTATFVPDEPIPVPGLTLIGQVASSSLLLSITAFGLMKKKRD